MQRDAAGPTRLPASVQAIAQNRAAPGRQLEPKLVPPTGRRLEFHE
jgi:hypothetical protein